MAAVSLFISRARFLSFLVVVGVFCIHIEDSYTGSPLEAGMMPDFLSFLICLSEDVLDFQLSLSVC